MKYVTLLLLAFLSCKCLWAQTVLVKDSTYEVDYGYGSTTINTYAYGADCKPLFTNNFNPYTDTRAQYAYNINGKLYQITTDILNINGIVIGGSRKTYKYTGNNGFASVHSEVWQDGTYVKDSLTYYQYNAQNQPTRKFIQLWNPNTTKFIDNRLDSMVYTSKGQLSELFTYLWSTGVKKLAYQSRKDYNPDGTLDTTADYDFVDFEQRVIGVAKYDYTYYDTMKKRYQVVTNYYESYLPGSWALANTRTLLHDSSNYVSYDTSTNTNYGNITQYVTRIYNTNNLLQSVYTINDNYGDGYIEQTLYTAYMYASCSPMAMAQTARTALPGSLPANTAALIVSPNPVHSVMHVSLPSPSKTNSAVRIYDAGGKLVTQQTVASGASSLTIDCSRLGRGLYIVRYEDGMQKMLKE